MAGCASAAPSPAAQSPSVWAFAAPWDRRSDASVSANGARLDGVVSGWIALDSVTGNASRQFPDEARMTALPGNRLALVTSWEGARFHPEIVRRIAGNAALLARVANQVAAIVASGGYGGVVFDLEGAARTDVSLMLRMIAVVGDSARARGATVVAAAIPAGDTTAYPTRAFAGAVDLLVVMLYDEHWSTSAPGPIASPQWVRQMLAQRVAEAGPGKLVAGLPLYGYLWRPGRAAEVVSFGDAVHASTEASVELLRDPVSGSLHAISQGNWELWSSDAEQLRALRSEVADLGVRKVALWRLGLEDPAVWRTLRR